MNDAFLQWVLYCVCMCVCVCDTRRGVVSYSGCGILKHPPNTPDLAPSDSHLFPNKKITSSCQAIQITCWYAWGANMAAWSGSHLLSTGFWEMDFPPRQVSKQRRWLCGKISEVKCSKWIKRHLTMWGYLVAVKQGTLLSDFPAYVCSVSYPACNAHAPYCRLCHAQLYNIFPRFLINGTIFEKKNIIENKMCVLIFCTTFG